MSRKRKQAGLVVCPGHHVLIGSPRVSMPGDWFLAYVLWADAEDVLIEHNPPGNQPMYRQVLPIEQVRAIGSVAALGAFKEHARKAVKALSDNVNQCGRALGAARDAVWRKIDEIGASGPLSCAEAA